MRKRVYDLQLFDDLRSIFNEENDLLADLSYTEEEREPLMNCSAYEIGFKSYYIYKKQKTIRLLH